MALASFPCAALLLTLLCESRLVRASGVPERILCVDSNCQEKIAEAITLQDYWPVDKNYVSFKRNDRVTIYGMGEDVDVLHVEIGNQRGYITASFVKIEKQFKKKDDLVEGKIPGLSSESSSTDATEAAKATVEPTLAQAVPSSSVTRSCKIHGTVMYDEYCDEFDATEKVADTSDDPTQLQTSTDSPSAVPYSALPLFGTPNGATSGSSVGEDTKLLSDDLPVTSATETLDTNATAAGKDTDLKGAAAADEHTEGSSSEAAKDDSEKLAEEVAVEEEEEGSEEAEDKPKPIPGEGDDDDDGHVEEVTPDDSDQVESSSASSKEVPTSLPSETSLDASPVDETAASSVATPPLERPEAVDTAEASTPTVSLQESSTSTSEASLAQEISYGFSQTDESRATFSMSAELPEPHSDASLPTEGSSPSGPLSSVGVPISVSPEGSLSASPVDDSAAMSNTAMPSSEQPQSVSAASTKDTSSADTTAAASTEDRFSAATEGLAASVETGRGERSADVPPSISTTPLSEPQQSDQTPPAEDLTLTTAHVESEPTTLASSVPVPAEELVGQPSPLFPNEPQVLPQLPAETFSIQDSSPPSLSSMAHQEPESSPLVASMSLPGAPGESPASQSTASLSAPQAHLVENLSAGVSSSVPQDSSSMATLVPLDAWSVSTAVDEPLASATTAPFVEQPVAASTMEDSSPVQSSVPPNQFQQEPVGSYHLAGSVTSNLVTQSLDPLQVRSAFSEEAISSAVPTPESVPAASLAPLTASPAESSAGGIGATEALDAHTTPSVPVGESLEPPPSLLPADGLAKPPGLPLPENLTQPTEDKPSGFVMDWKVLEEYLWQVLALVPEPLRAALEWPLVPSLPLLMACCALLVFSLGASLHAAWLQRCKVSSLTGILSEREQELFTLKTERQVLSEQLAQAKKDSVGNDHLLCEQKRELETLREEAAELNKKVDKLTGQLSEKVQQLESAQSALQQAQKLLKERSEEAKERGDAAASLEEQLREACEERDRWQEQARESEAQEQMLRQSLTDATETSDRLWAELEALKHRQEELCEEVAASSRQADSVAEKLREKEDRIQVLESSLEQLELLQKRWRSRKSENESENGAENEVGEEDSEEASEEDGRRHSELRELLDATQARRERDRAEEQCRQLQAQLDELREKLQSQEAQVVSLRKELESSVAIKVESERKCTEAQTKLEVLTEYFKGREVQLQKEVGLQEVQRRQREADANTTAQHVAVLEQQCQSLQSQLDSLHQEMQLTERNYKNQVTDQEKRAHDNWLAARAAERKLEDANRELSTLRQRLTLAERELQQRPPLLPPPPPDMFPPPPLPPRPRSKDGEVSSLDGSVPPPPPPDMLVPPPPPLFGPFGMFGPFPPPPPPELRKMMRSGGGSRGSPGYYEDDDELGSPMPPPPHHHHHYMTPPPREGRSSRTSRSSSASESRGRPLKSSPQSPLSDDRRNGTSGRSTPL